MFVRLVLISAVLNFVCARSIETREIQPVSFHGEPHMDIDMDAEATTTEEEHALHTLLLPKGVHISPDTAEIDPSHVHLEKDPKKRATNYRDGYQPDSRPGCCG